MNNLDLEQRANAAVKFAMDGLNDLAEQCFERGVTPEGFASLVICRMVLGLVGNRSSAEVRNFLVGTVDRYLLMYAKDNQ
jgi:hypothetical protein